MKQNENRNLKFKFARYSVASLDDSGTLTFYLPRTLVDSDINQSINQRFVT